MVVLLACASGGEEESHDPVSAEEAIGTADREFCVPRTTRVPTQDEYLIATLPIEANLQQRSAEFLQGFFVAQARSPALDLLLDEHQLGFQQLTRAFSGALGLACAIVPATEARTHHAAILRVYADVTVLALSINPDGITLRFAGDLFAQVELFGQIASEGHLLVVDALQERDDALSVYLATLTRELLDHQERLSGLGVNRVFASPLTNDIASLEGLGAEINLFDQRVRALEPPTAARALHARQLDVNAAEIEQSRGALAARELFRAVPRGEAEYADAYRASDDVGAATAVLIERRGAFTELWYALVLKALAWED